MIREEKEERSGLFYRFCEILCPNMDKVFSQRVLGIFERNLDSEVGLANLVEQAEAFSRGKFKPLVDITRPPKVEQNKDYKLAASAYIESQTGIRLPVSTKIFSGFYEQIILSLNKD